MTNGNNRKKNGQKNRFLIFSVILFSVILVAGSLAYVFSMRQIVKTNIGNELTQMLETEHIRLESSLNAEIAIAIKMANSPVVKRYLLNPEDPELEAVALEEIASYRNAFTGDSIFWINDIDRIFYSTYSEPYWVDANDPINYWYNMTLYETEVYNFNINYNPDLNVIRLWVNAPVFDEGGNPAGMVGTGIELSAFIDIIYGNISESTELYFFISNGWIYGARDVSLIMDRVGINDVLHEMEIDILAAALNLETLEKQIFDAPNRIAAVGAIPLLDWYYVAVVTYGVADYDTAMTALFFAVLVLILFIIIIFNIFISKYLDSLRSTMDSLEIASKAKSEFLATMSHEIRTPLNAVIGFSEIEMLGALNDNSKENIRQINQSGTTLLGIIGDILDISKIEAGRFELDTAEYEMASLLSDTLHLNMVRIGSKPINFILEIGGDFPSRLVGDELRIKQILNNLLSNAIKYTNEGRVTLTIEWENRRALLSKGEEVLLRFLVRDTGTGIRKEDMGKLFESYTQLDSGTNRKMDGTGLGLTITKTLVEMMGGSISVESEHGKGSVFSAEIVQKFPEQGLNGTQCIGEETAENLRNFRYEIKRAQEHIERPFLPGGKVLVVDDNIANLQVMRGMLAPYGLSVETAVSGREALEKIKSAMSNSTGASGYDLILMDHMMPEMDGIEAATAIHEIESVPVVALTANALRGMREHYIEQGFVDYLSKPINPLLLNDVIIKWIPDRTTEAQRFDKLNHYRAAFDSGREIDSAYYQRFAALVSAIDLTGTDPGVKEQADVIIDAAKKGDPVKIREILPALCESLRKKQTDMFAAAGALTPEGNERMPGESLKKLKKALLNGDSKTAIMILEELGGLGLDPAGRELYFLLYDFLSEGKTDRAVDALFFWEKFDK